jgi:diguanylate cyclase (GGDEF)-like protein/putative nucleotidyltransferase with HDIG domain/PAS domain S-box-containing protein
MNRISAATRISIAIVCLTITVLLGAQTLGLLPNAFQEALDGRKKLCESLAIYCSLAGRQGDVETVREAAVAIMSRNPEVLSLALRKADGSIVVQTGNHEKHWKELSGEKSTSTQVQVPLFEGKERWGNLQISFKPLAASGFWGFLHHPVFKLIAFIATAGYLVYLFYLRKTLQYLDPSSVIPGRVKAMLDTLAEGVLVLDKQERIVLANESFGSLIGRPAAGLQGTTVSKLPWSTPESDSAPSSFPWMAAITANTVQRGTALSLPGTDGGKRTVTVNCAPITGGDGNTRGALVTFDDVTVIEAKNTQLRNMLDMLKQSRDEIDRQNRELQALATTDPLTGCRNRRSFYSEFQTHWSRAERYNEVLSCVMVDVDHFKRINDRYGHSVGDQVLQHVAERLRSMVRDCDLICRYGGEEFCVVLPQTNLDAAKLAGERYRHAIETSPCGSIAVTVSVGVSSITLGAHTPLELLDQADKSLYGAKRGGRNRVASWDQVRNEGEIADRPNQVEAIAAADAQAKAPILFSAVSALMSALAYRDKGTAAHSQRVADLCVAASANLIPIADLFVLEVAALLHDIGKLGVPDTILLKPGPLTPEEWKIMRGHDQMGEEIIAAAFASPELTNLVRMHHAWFGGSPHVANLPQGEKIPVAARILSIADAYDAMTSDRVYRKGRSREDAFAELRRCAGTQFDPQLVERFIEAVLAREASHRHRSASATPRTALMIRLDVERLACAVEARNLSMLTELARRVASAAAEDGLLQVAECANEVQRAATGSGDVEQIRRLTDDLLKLCRSSPQPMTPAKAEIRPSAAA